MRLAICALLLIACSQASPEDVKTRADIRGAIATNGWDAECSEFVTMTPEERVSAAGGLVAFGIVPDSEAAIRFLNIAVEECRKPH